MKKFTFKAEIWVWSGAQGAWHFVYVGDKESIAVKDMQSKTKIGRRGFGAVKVEVTIGKTTWCTSLFPTKEGPYVLPLKASVRKAEGLFEGNTVTITCKLV